MTSLRHKIDNLNSGRYDGDSVFPLRNIQSLDVGRNPDPIAFGSIIASRNRMWGLRESGELSIFDLRTNSFEESISLDGNGYSTPVYDDDTYIYIQTSEYIYKISSVSKTIIWKKSIFNETTILRASLILHDSYLYAVTEDSGNSYKKLLKININNARTEDEYQFDMDDNTTVFSPAVYNDKLYLSYINNGDLIIAEIDPEDMTAVEDSVSASSEIISGDSVIDDNSGKIYISTYDYSGNTGTIHIFDTSVSTWSTLGDTTGIDTSVSIDNQGNVIAGYVNGEIRKYNSSGVLQWSIVDTNDVFKSPPLIDSQDNILLHAVSGMTYLFDENGDNCWAKQAGRGLYQIPSLYKDRVYINDRSGKIIELHEQSLQFDLQGKIREAVPISVSASWMKTDRFEDNDMEYLFNLLPNFWNYFEDNDFLKRLWSGYACLVMDHIHFVEQLNFTLSIHKAPLYIKRFFLKVDSKSQEVFLPEKDELFNISGKIQSIPYLVDSFKNPTVRLLENEDYTVENGLLSFNDEPELKEYWAVEYYVDYGLLYDNLGLLVDIKKSDMVSAKDIQGNIIPVTQEAYYKAIKNVWKAYITAPTVFNMQNAVNSLVSLPIASKNGKIVDIVRTPIGEEGEGSLEKIVLEYFDGTGESFSSLPLGVDDTLPSGLNMAQKLDRSGRLTINDEVKEGQALTDGAEIIDKVNSSNYLSLIKSFKNQFRAGYYNDFSGDITPYRVIKQEGDINIINEQLYINSTDQTLISLDSINEPSRLIQMRFNPQGNDSKIYILTAEDNSYYYGIGIEGIKCHQIKVSKTDLSVEYISDDPDTILNYINVWNILAIQINYNKETGQYDNKLYIDNDFIFNEKYSFKAKLQRNIIFIDNSEVYIDYYQNSPAFSSDFDYNLLPSENEILQMLAANTFIVSVSADSVVRSHFKTDAIKGFIENIKPTWKSFIFSVFMYLVESFDETGENSLLLDDQDIELDLESAYLLTTTIRKYDNPVNIMSPGEFAIYAASPESFPEKHLGIECLSLRDGGIEETYQIDIQSFQDGSDSIVLNGNMINFITPTVEFNISNSSSNDGTYTVDIVEYNPALNKTIIYVTGTILADTSTSAVMIIDVDFTKYGRAT